ncbi:MAG: flavin reductase family protein [Bacteroidetes bacterium]|nr:flavin reductase family protein [Bacteroidota bacterium]
MKTINPKEVSIPEFHALILGSVAPRPIAFASTVDKAGNVNLSPFSFFNAFSANPPTLIFSPARRVRDNTTKHTLENVYETMEVVINIVDHNIVEQASLASTEYDKNINEFIKAGLTQVPSDIVSPPRVGESPAAYECKVKQVIELGLDGGAGNLIICEVLLAHFKEHIFDENGKIDPHKIDLVARMGADWYCRAKGDLFEVPKPVKTKGIGVDNIPEPIKNSDILTGNNLGRLGNIETLPDKKAVEAFRNQPVICNIIEKYKGNTPGFIKEIHIFAQKLLQEGQVEEAWKALLLTQSA